MRRRCRCSSPGWAAHTAYLWSYSSSEYDELKTVIYDFTEGRGGVYARDFLGSWSGKLVCDDYSG